MTYGLSYIYYGDDPTENLKTYAENVEDIIFFWIHHIGEEGDKDHWHIYALTHRKQNNLSPMLRSLLGKKLNIAVVNKINNLGTMYGYAIHDANMLAKNQDKREFTYRDTDLKTTDDDMLCRIKAEYYQELQKVDWLYQNVKRAFETGMTKSEATRANYMGIATYHQTREYVEDLYNDLKGVKEDD